MRTGRLKYILFVTLFTLITLMTAGFSVLHLPKDHKDLYFSPFLAPNFTVGYTFFVIGIAFYFGVLGWLIKKSGKDYLLNFFKEIKQSRTLILSLAKNDVKSRFSGSFFGVFWAVLSPLLTVLVYWFVFQVGFKTSNIQEIPFIIWFIPGIVPWFFFAETVSSSTNSYVEYSYLVKKVVFNINILPLVKILSVFFINIFFVGILLVVNVFYEELFSIYNIQLLYYLICLSLLTYGIVLITSSVSVFFKDLNQIIAIILQFGFWMTPIVWDTSNAPKFLGHLFQLNPMVYIVDGFRDSFLYEIWFFEKPLFTIYFWSLTFLLIFLGLLINKRLKPHFSDVL